MKYNPGMCTVDVNIFPFNLKGSLYLSSNSSAIVIFVHGSGSNRFSERNLFFSQMLNKQGFSTLLVDLLNDEEKREDILKENLRFNIEFLSQRLYAITTWVINHPLTKNMMVGYFCSSTGTAAAIKICTKFPQIKGIVSRSGRTDLIDEDLFLHYLIPTLFIVGEKDPFVISVNKKTLKQIPDIAFKKMVIIPKASHFFDEHTVLNDVGDLSIKWFKFCFFGDPFKFHNHFLKQSLFRYFDIYSKLKFKLQSRVSAGYILANILSKYQNRQDVIIAGISNGGVIVADSLATHLYINNFCVIVTKRIRDPYDYEKTIGAISGNESIYMLPESKDISSDYINMEIKRQKNYLEKQISLYNFGDPKLLDLKEYNIILVDDGVYSCSTIMAAINCLKSKHAKNIVLAIPVISKKSLLLLSKQSYKVESILNPKSFYFVDEFYNDFKQIGDAEIIEILKKRREKDNILQVL